MTWAPTPHHWPAAFDIGDEHFVVDDLINQRAQEAMRRQTAINERVIRRLLGQWVSELEPVIFVRQADGLIMGLGAAGHHEPTIRNTDMTTVRPLDLHDFMTGRIF